MRARHVRLCEYRRIYVHTHIFICTAVQTCACSQTYRCKQMHTYLHVCICIHRYPYGHYVRIRTHIYKPVRAYPYMYVCTIRHRLTHLYINVNACTPLYIHVCSLRSRQEGSGQADIAQETDVDVSKWTTCTDMQLCAHVCACMYVSDMCTYMCSYMHQ